MIGRKTNGEAAGSNWHHDLDRKDNGHVMRPTTATFDDAVLRPYYEKLPHSQLTNRSMNGVAKPNGILVEMLRGRIRQLESSNIYNQTKPFLLKNDANKGSKTGGYFPNILLPLSHNTTTTQMVLETKENNGYFFLKSKSPDAGGCFETSKVDFGRPGAVLSRGIYSEETIPYNLSTESEGEMQVSRSNSKASMRKTSQTSRSPRGVQFSDASFLEDGMTRNLDTVTSNELPVCIDTNSRSPNRPFSRKQLIDQRRILVGNHLADSKQNRLHVYTESMGLEFPLVSNSPSDSLIIGKSFKLVGTNRGANHPKASAEDSFLQVHEAAYKNNPMHQSNDKQTSTPMRALTRKTVSLAGKMDRAQTITRPTQTSIKIRMGPPEPPIRNPSIKSPGRMSFSREHGHLYQNSLTNASFQLKRVNVPARLKHTKANMGPKRPTIKEVFLQRKWTPVLSGHETNESNRVFPTSSQPSPPSSSSSSSYYSKHQTFSRSLTKLKASKSRIRNWLSGNPKNPVSGRPSSTHCRRQPPIICRENGRNMPIPWPVQVYGEFLSRERQSTAMNDETRDTRRTITVEQIFSYQGSRSSALNSSDTITRLSNHVQSYKQSSGLRRQSTTLSRASESLSCMPPAPVNMRLQGTLFEQRHSEREYTLTSRTSSAHAQTCDDRFDAVKGVLQCFQPSGRIPVDSESSQEMLDTPLFRKQPNRDVSHLDDTEYHVDPILLTNKAAVQRKARDQTANPDTVHSTRGLVASLEVYKAGRRAVSPSGKQFAYDDPPRGDAERNKLRTTDSLEMYGLRVGAGSIQKRQKGSQENVKKSVKTATYKYRSLNAIKIPKIFDPKDSLELYNRKEDTDLETKSWNIEENLKLSIKSHKGRWPPRTTESPGKKPETDTIQPPNVQVFVTSPNRLDATPTKEIRNFQSPFPSCDLRDLSELEEDTFEGFVSCDVNEGTQSPDLCCHYPNEVKKGIIAVHAISILEKQWDEDNANPEKLSNDALDGTPYRVEDIRPSAEPSTLEIPPREDTLLTPMSSQLHDSTTAYTIGQNSQPQLRLTRKLPSSEARSQIVSENVTWADSALVNKVQDTNLRVQQNRGPRSLDRMPNSAFTEVDPNLSWGNSNPMFPVPIAIEQRDNTETTFSQIPSLSGDPATRYGPSKRASDQFLQKQHNETSPRSEEDGVSETRPGSNLFKYANEADKLQMPTTRERNPSISSLRRSIKNVLSGLAGMEQKGLANVAPFPDESVWDKTITESEQPGNVSDQGERMHGDSFINIASAGVNLYTEDADDDFRSSLWPQGPARQYSEEGVTVPFVGSGTCRLQQIPRECQVTWCEDSCCTRRGVDLYGCPRYLSNPGLLSRANDLKTRESELLREVNLSVTMPKAGGSNFILTDNSIFSNPTNSTTLASLTTAREAEVDAEAAQKSFLRTPEEQERFERAMKTKSKKKRKKKESRKRRNSDERADKLQRIEKLFTRGMKEAGVAGGQDNVTLTSTRPIADKNSDNYAPMPLGTNPGEARPSENKLNEMDAYIPRKRRTTKKDHEKSNAGINENTNRKDNSKSVRNPTQTIKGASEQSSLLLNAELKESKSRNSPTDKGKSLGSRSESAKTLVREPDKRTGEISVIRLENDTADGWSADAENRQPMSEDGPAPTTPSSEGQQLAAEKGNSLRSPAASDARTAESRKIDDDGDPSRSAKRTARTTKTRPKNEAIEGPTLRNDELFGVSESQLGKTVVIYAESSRRKSKHRDSVKNAEKRNSLKVPSTKEVTPQGSVEIDSYNQENGLDKQSKVRVRPKGNSKQNMQDKQLHDSPSGAEIDIGFQPTAIRLEKNKNKISGEELNATDASEAPGVEMRVVELSGTASYQVVEVSGFVEEESSEKSVVVKPVKPNSLYDAKRKRQSDENGLGKTRSVGMVTIDISSELKDDQEPTTSDDEDTTKGNESSEGTSEAEEEDEVGIKEEEEKIENQKEESEKTIKERAPKLNVNVQLINDDKVGESLKQHEAKVSAVIDEENQPGVVLLNIIVHLKDATTNDCGARKDSGDEGEEVVEVEEEEESEEEEKKRGNRKELKDKITNGENTKTGSLETRSANKKSKSKTQDTLETENVEAKGEEGENEEDNPTGFKAESEVEKNKLESIEKRSLDTGNKLKRPDMLNEEEEEDGEYKRKNAGQDDKSKIGTLKTSLSLPVPTKMRLRSFDDGDETVQTMSTQPPNEFKTQTTTVPEGWAIIPLPVYRNQRALYAAYAKPAITSVDV